MLGDLELDISTTKYGLKIKSRYSKTTSQAASSLPLFLFAIYPDQTAGPGGVYDVAPL
jgi:hypothetical protein